MTQAERGRVQGPRPAVSGRVIGLLVGGVVLLSGSLPLGLTYGFTQPQLIVLPDSFGSLEVSKTDDDSPLYIRVVVKPGPPVDVYIFDAGGYDLYVQGRWTFGHDYVGITGLYDELYLVAGTYFLVVDNSDYGRTRPTGDVAYATYAVTGGHVVNVTGESTEGASPILSFGLGAGIALSIGMIAFGFVGIFACGRRRDRMRPPGLGTP